MRRLLCEEGVDGPVDADALAVRGGQESCDVDALLVEEGHLGGHVRPVLPRHQAGQHPAVEEGRSASAAQPGASFSSPSASSPSLPVRLF
ncbi:hypothetical protein [Streptomyces sp. NRRL F-2747]|uniref:hypothetical protein n=1 Tax=Streptomyces sp. NRRL F-2747 TaxID=1463843 RepID=UPI0004C6A83A|nr:hypothetical protein [Streptomyces sp. NRRL F-2747]